MKDIVAVTGKYTKDGQEKAEFTKIGAIGFNQNTGKEWMILDPSVSLAGVLAKQNALALSRGEEQRATVMCSIFDRSQQQPQQSQGYQQQAPQMQQQPQGGLNNDDIPWNV